MALINSKLFRPELDANNGIDLVDQLQLAARATAPEDADLADGRIYYDSAVKLFKGRANSGWVTLSAGTGGFVGTWDELYDNDKTLSIDDGTLTFSVAGNTAGLTINKSATGAGAPLVVVNNGTGNDITITGKTQNTTLKSGVLELSSSGTINANDGALSIGKTATATTLVGTCVIAEGLTVTTGGVAIAAGVNTIVATSNTAPSLMLTNNTITTYGGATASTGAVVLRSTTLTSGTLLKLQTTEATLDGGNYLDCYDVTAAGIVFKIAEDGATTITGLAATNVFTVTAGDLVVSDGSLTMTDTDDASTLAITNNSCATGVMASFVDNGLTSGKGLQVSHTTSVITTGSVAKISSTSVDTGTNQGTLLDLVSSGTAAGLVVKLTAAALDTGTAMSIVTAAQTEGITLLLTGGGANLTTGMVQAIDMGAATDGTGLNILTSGVYIGTLGVLDINAADATTGTIVDINGDGLTSGTALKINATEATLTSGKYIACYDGAANDFSIAKYGATVIAGNAVGTAAFTITNGDIVLGAGTVTYRQLTEYVSATNVLTAAESGKTCFLGHATEFATTLPAVAAGLHFKFIVALAPSGASYTIGTNAGADIIHGAAVSSADAGGSCGSTAGTPADTITFVNGQAMVGDWIEVVCDGTYWYAFGVCSDEDAITFSAT